MSRRLSYNLHVLQDEGARAYLRELRNAALFNLRNQENLDHPVWDYLGCPVSCLLFFVCALASYVVLRYVLHLSPGDYDFLGVLLTWGLFFGITWLARALPRGRRKAARRLKVQYVQPLVDYYRGVLSDDALLEAITSGTALEEVPGLPRGPRTQLTRGVATRRIGDRTYARRFGTFIDAFEKVLKHYHQDAYPDSVTPWQRNVLTLSTQRIARCALAIALANKVRREHTDLEVAMGLKKAVPAD